MVAAGILAVVVLIFRVAAWLNPSASTGITGSAANYLNALGVLFLACGLWAWLARPSILTRVFLAYCAGMALHWGGAIRAGNAEVETALLVFYAAATATADGAFLDLSLRYPRARCRPGLRTAAFYILAVLTLLAVPIPFFLPGPAVATGLSIVFMLAFGMSIVAGLVFMVKWIRTSHGERREALLTPVVGALISASLIDLLGEIGILPGKPDAWKLVYGTIPLVFAWALVRGELSTAEATVHEH